MKPSRKTVIFLTLIVLLSFLGFALTYWFYFLPQQDRIAALKQSISEEEQLISKLEQSHGTGDGEILTRTTALQERLPVAPLIDQFILDLEEVEILSGSTITSFSFTDEGTANEGTSSNTVQGTSESGQDNGQQDQNTGNQDQNSSQNNENSQTTANAGATEAVQLPEGIKRITVSMTVEAPSYKELQAFIKGIEDLPRITKIDALTFTGYKEVRELTTDPLEDKLVYNVTVSTFYFPELEELKSQLPTYETPPPANRLNPLYPQPKGTETDINEESVDQNSSSSGNSNGTTESNNSTNSNAATGNKSTTTTNNNQTVSSAGTAYRTEQKDGKQYKVYKYTVKPGETLFSIALDKYNSKDGPELLQDWNGIAPADLRAGDTIEIPILVEDK